MSLINCITPDEINKIFHNNENKRNYLKAFLKKYYPTVSVPKRNLDNCIIEYWDYEKSKGIIRELFKQTDKYRQNSQAQKKLEDLIKSWNKEELGLMEWPFQAIMFDRFVHQLNRKELSEKEKDNILSTAAIKFRRIKDINAWRNDYIEYLIFEKFDNVIPTFENTNGVDFYINGEPYDQKVSRSVTKLFIEQHPNNYKDEALKQRDIVAKCLYEYQDEARFGFEPRLLVVYLDSDLSTENIQKSLDEVDFNSPLEIDFSFTHSGNTRTYQTKCFIILLHK